MLLVIHVIFIICSLTRLPKRVVSLRYRRVQVCGWPWGFPLSGSRPVLVPVVRFYSDVPNPNSKAPGGNPRSGTVVVKERALAALQVKAHLGFNKLHGGLES